MLAAAAAADAGVDVGAGAVVVAAAAVVAAESAVDPDHGELHHKKWNVNLYTDDYKRVVYYDNYKLIL